MTVCTNDVALGNLVEDGLPVAVAETFGYAEALVPEVVELENQRIGLAAVDAWVLSKERQQSRGALDGRCTLAADSGGNVACAVCGVVLAFVGGTAWPAVVVALAAGFATPGEV
jgi:hypothetical protein